jgi:hypothetical protein
VFPDPPAVGVVRAEARLPDTWIPDNQFGKRCESRLLREGSSEPVARDFAVEDDVIAHRLCFPVPIDQPGRWAVEICACWGDGTPFADGLLQFETRAPVK